MKTLPLALLFLALAPAAALADVPPPDDYVEDCTIEKQQQPGVECQSCRAWHGERDACDKTLGTQGFGKRCQSWGASAWSEVWCKGEPTGPKPAETPGPSDSGSKKSGCDAGGSALLGLLALPLILRRGR